MRPVNASPDGTRAAGASPLQQTREKLEFELGCLSHTTHRPSTMPPYRIESRHYMWLPARVRRPETGIERAAVICGRCGKEVTLEVASRRTVLGRRVANLLLAAALIVFIVIEYSGPTGEISTGRALLLFGAFVAIFVVLFSVLRAFRADANLAVKVAGDTGDHEVSARAKARGR